MNRILSRILVVLVLTPSFSMAGAWVAAAETSTDAAISLSAMVTIDTTSAPAATTSATMTPEMQQMMSEMDALMDPEAMQLHMDLMSPAMKQMMSQMMGGTSDASATAGSQHDHAGHSTGSGVHRFGESSLEQRAVSLSRSTYGTGTVASAVVANGARGDDILQAASLAGSIGGPVLPATSSAVSEVVASELGRLGVERVYIVGGTGHISASVQGRLESLGFTVSRVSGPTRAATATAVARKVAAVRGARTIGTVFVVSSDRPWDALTVSPYAYAKKIPVLFVSGSGIPAATTKALASLRVKHAIVVGSGISIKASTYRAVARATSGTDTRIAADTRWALADTLARYAVAKQWVTAAHPVIVNGTSSPSDAVIAGTHAGAKASVLVLSPAASLPRTARVFLVENRGTVTHPVVVGTTVAVEDAVLVDIQSLLQGASH